MHSTPSRNDRFKVVKIASLEPFRRGRWKCMDYVDENPPQPQPSAKQTQSATNIQMGGSQYMQTQSLPPQHFQQMLVQSGFAGSPAAGFYQGMPNQMLPGQYFYPHGNAVISQQVPVQTGSTTGMQQFINAAGQPYFPANVPPHAASAGFTYSNVQYVQPNLIQTQSSAFVPTSQTANFQQSQTYAGQPTTAQQQPMVNGHAFPPGGGTESPQVVASLPTQIAKNVILQPAIASMNQTPPTVGQNSISQPAQYNPAYQPASLPANQTPAAQLTNITAVTQVTQGTPIITPVPAAVQPSSQITNPAAVSQAVTLTAASAFNQMHIAQIPIPIAHSAPASSTNPMYVAQGGVPNADDGQGDVVGESKNPDNPEAGQPGEDPAKANPVVNAIDNKIEQAMDLVKSHLMYTVREEVEVLKEKIVELMERIQQLETENAYLKQQVLKGAGAPPPTNGTTTSTNDGTPDPTSQTPTQQPPAPQ
ncbi:TSC22 domain family protein 1 isoform X2 [Atheta coriaria]